jgi:predicted nucleic acid-binding protein
VVKYTYRSVYAVRIYLDVCCLNRPFDDLTQERIQFESEAILAILSRCQAGNWTLVVSEAVYLELNRIRNDDKLKKILTLLSMAREKLILDEAAIKRSSEFQKNGIKPMDSLHLAVAEISKVDVFLTTDDAFLRAANKIDLNIIVENPVKWYMEVMQNEQ